MIYSNFKLPFSSDIEAYLSDSTEDKDTKVTTVGNTLTHVVHKFQTMPAE